MLYVNVHCVSQQYGGPEEGGWYYDVGEPIASIPVKSKYEPGKGYYLTSDTEGYGRKAKVVNVKINLRVCDCCKGTGQVEEEDETYPDRGTFMARCTDCGEIPEDLEATAKLFEQMYAMFDEEGTASGRYEHISVSLQDHFASSYPDRKPHYE
jgi:hypothetical protein